MFEVFSTTLFSEVENYVVKISNKYGLGLNLRPPAYRASLLTTKP